MISHIRNVEKDDDDFEDSNYATVGSMGEHKYIFQPMRYEVSSETDKVWIPRNNDGNPTMAEDCTVLRSPLYALQGIYSITISPHARAS